MAIEPLAANPTPIRVGHTYFNTAANELRTWDGAAWASGGGGGGGVSDHGALTGLGDDDHTQYHTDARANTWLSGKDTDAIAEGATNLYVTAAQRTKINNISVSQAVDLDQMELDVAALANGMVYKGDWDASAGSFPASSDTGHFYYVNVAGTVDGVDFQVGDNIVATTDGASTTTYSGNWSKHDQTDAVQSVNGQTGSVTLVAGDVGLGNVDNTSDADKPVSTAQQTALNAKPDKYSQTIGDGSATAIVVTHNLGSRDVVASIRDASTHDEVICDVQHTTTNTTTFTFASAPASNAYRVTVVG